MHKLFAAGLVIFLAGFGLMMAGSFSQGGYSAGGAVFFGPFPIVFGSGPNGLGLALVSVVIGGIMLVLLLLWGRRLGGNTS